MAKEMSLYDKKLMELKKFIPFLDNMEDRLKSATGDKIGVQLTKIQGLKNLIKGDKRMKMENLLKCEQVLTKLYEKTMEKIASNQNTTKDTVVEENSQDTCSSEASLGDKKDETDLKNEEEEEVKPKLNLNFYKEHCDVEAETKKDAVDGDICENKATSPEEPAASHDGPLTCTPVTAEVLPTREIPIIPTSPVRSEQIQTDTFNIPNQSKAVSTISTITTDAAICTVISTSNCPSGEHIPTLLNRQPTKKNPIAATAKNTPTDLYIRKPFSDIDLRSDLDMRTAFSDVDLRFNNVFINDTSSASFNSVNDKTVTSAAVEPLQVPENKSVPFFNSIPVLLGRNSTTPHVSAPSNNFTLPTSNDLGSTFPIYNNSDFDMRFMQTNIMPSTDIKTLSEFNILTLSEVRSDNLYVPASSEVAVTDNSASDTTTSLEIQNDVFEVNSRNNEPALFENRSAQLESSPQVHIHSDVSTGSSQHQPSQFQSSHLEKLSQVHKIETSTDLPQLHSSQVHDKSVVKFCEDGLEIVNKFSNNSKVEEKGKNDAEQKPQIKSVVKVQSPLLSPTKKTFTRVLVSPPKGSGYSNRSSGSRRRYSKSPRRYSKSPSPRRRRSRSPSPRRRHSRSHSPRRRRSRSRDRYTSSKYKSCNREEKHYRDSYNPSKEKYRDKVQSQRRGIRDKSRSKSSRRSKSKEESSHKKNKDPVDPQGSKNEIKLLGKKIYEILELNELKRKREKLMQELQEESFLIPEKSPEPQPSHKGEREDGELGASDEEVDMLYSDLVEDETKKKTDKPKAKPSEPAPTKTNNIASSLMKLNKILKDQSFKQEVLNVKSATVETVTESFTVSRTLHTSREALFKTMADIITSEIVPMEKKQIDNEMKQIEHEKKQTDNDKITEAKTPVLKTIEQMNSHDPLISTPDTNTGDSVRNKESFSLKSHHGLEGVTSSSSESHVKSVDSSLQDDILKALASETGSDITISGDKKEESAKETMNKSAKDLLTIKSRRISLETYKEKHSINVKCEDLILENHKKYEDIVKSIFSPKELAKFDPILPKQTEQRLALDVVAKTGVSLTKLSHNNTIMGIENIDKNNKVEAPNKVGGMTPLRGMTPSGMSASSGMTPLPPWATPVNRQFEFQPKKHVYSNILGFTSNSILSPEQEDNVMDSNKRGILNSAYDNPKSLTSLGLGSPNTFPSSRLSNNSNSVKPFISNDGIFSPTSGFETPDISQQNRQNFPQSKEASVPPSPRFDGNLGSSINETDSFACRSRSQLWNESYNPYDPRPKPLETPHGNNPKDSSSWSSYGRSYSNEQDFHQVNNYGSSTPNSESSYYGARSPFPSALRDNPGSYTPLRDTWSNSDAWGRSDSWNERFTPARDYDNKNTWTRQDCDNAYPTDTLGNHTPRMNYDNQWTNDQFSSLRDRNMERRNFEREISVTRQTPSSNFVRERSVGRQTPARNFDRETSIGRQTPSRNFDRERSIGRQTPSRDVDYENSEFNVGRQFRNDGEAYYNERLQCGPSTPRLDYQPVDSSYNLVNKFERARSVGRSVCNSNLDTQKKYSDQADHYDFRNHNFETTNKFARSRSVGRSLYETKLESRAKSVGPRSQFINSSMFPAYNGKSTFKLEKRSDNNLSEFQCKVKRSQSLSRECPTERDSFPHTKYDYSNKNSLSVTKPMQKAIELIENSKKSHNFRDPRLNKDSKYREVSRSSKDPRLKKFDKNAEKDDLLYDKERHKDKNRSTNSSRIENSDNKTKSNDHDREGRSLKKDNNSSSIHKRSSSNTSTHDKNRPKNNSHSFTKDERRESSSIVKKETKSDLNKSYDSKMSIRSEHRNQREKISHFKIPKIKKTEIVPEIHDKKPDTKTSEIKNELLETQQSHIKGKDFRDFSKKELQVSKVRKGSVESEQESEKLDSVSYISNKVAKELIKTTNKKKTDRTDKSKNKSQADKFAILDSCSTSEQDDYSDSEPLKLPSKTTSTLPRLTVEYSSSDESDSISSSIQTQITNYDKQFDELLNNQQTKIDFNLLGLNELPAKCIKNKSFSPITDKLKVTDNEEPQINIKIQKTKPKTRNKKNESLVKSIGDNKEIEVKLNQDIDKITIDPHSIHTAESVTSNDDQQTKLEIDDQDNIECSSKSLSDLPIHELEVEKQSDSEKSNNETDSPLKSRLRSRIRQDIKTSDVSVSNKATRASERKIKTPKTTGAKENENKVKQKSSETIGESGLDNNVVDSSNLNEVSKSVETDNSKELDVSNQSTSKDIELNKKDNQSDITNLVEILKNKDKMMQILAMLSNNEGEEISSKMKKRLELLAEIDSDEEDNYSKSKEKHSTVDADVSKSNESHSTTQVDASKSKQTDSKLNIDTLKNKESHFTDDIDTSKSEESHSTTQIDASKSKQTDSKLNIDTLKNKESHFTDDIDTSKSEESHSLVQIDASKSKQSDSSLKIDTSKSKQLDSMDDIDASKSEELLSSSQEPVVTSQNASCLENALPKDEGKPLENNEIEKESLGNKSSVTSGHVDSMGDDDKIKSTNNGPETDFVDIDNSKKSESCKFFEKNSVEACILNQNEKDLSSQNVNNEKQTVNELEVVNSDCLDEANKPVVESIDTSLPQEMSEEDPNKKPSKKKTKGSRELQMLHEYNFDMFISADVLKATGVRSCTISHLDNIVTAPPKNNEPILKATKPPVTKVKPTKTKINKPSKIKPKKSIKSTGNKSKDSDSLLPRVVVEKTSVSASTTKDIYEYSDDNSAVEDYQFIKQKPCPKSKKLLANTADVPDSSELNITNELDIAKVSSQMLKTKKKKSKKKRNSWQSGIIKKKKRGNILPTKDLDYCGMDYYFKEKIKEYKCKLCNYTGQHIVKHYKIQHPHSEVMISRLSPDQARQACEEGIKHTNNKTPKIKMYRCRFCMRLFRVKNLRTIFDHIVFSHTGEYKKECSLCSTKDSKKCVSVCNKSSTLPPADDFIDCVTGYMCGLCNYTQLSHENLKTHIWLRHFTEECELKEINLTMQNARRRVLKDGLEIAKTEAVVIRSKPKPPAALEPEVVLTPRLRARKIVSPPKTTKSKSLPPKRKETIPQKKSDKLDSDDNKSDKLQSDDNKSDKLESDGNKSNQDLGDEGTIPDLPEIITENVDLPLSQPPPLVSESGIFHSSSDLGEANIKQEIHEEQFLEDATTEMANITIKTEYPCENNELNKGVIKVGLLQTNNIGDKTEYSCFINDCKFVSFYLLIFMSHVDGHNADWDGFCSVCNKKINSNVNTQFKYDMALQHLLSAHSKGDQHVEQDNTVKIKQEVVDEPEECSSSQPKTSEDYTDQRITAMNDKKPLLKDIQEDDFFQRSLENLPGFLPKINVRSLEHLLDNNDPRTNSSNQPATLVPTVSADRQSISDTVSSHTEAPVNMNAFNDSNSPGLCQLRIENVVSLNPNSSSPFADNPPEFGSKALNNRPEQKNETQSNRKICISKVDTKKGTTTSKTILPYYPISKLLFKCVECIFKADEMDQFIAHFSVRDHSALCKCSYCSFACPDPKVLSHHILEEHGPSRYNCMLCEYRAAVPLLVATHALAFHKVKLLTVDEIEPHKSIQDGDMVKGIMAKSQCVSPFICKYKDSNTLSVCNSKFFSSNAFGRHIIKIHGVSAQLECQICLGTRYIAKPLLCHMKKTHKWKLLACSYCGDAFDTKAEALGHLIVRHSGRRPLLYMRLDTSSKSNVQVEEDKVVLLNLDKGEFYRKSLQTSPMKFDNPSMLTSKEFSIILETENKQRRLAEAKGSMSSASTTRPNEPSGSILKNILVEQSLLLPSDNSKDLLSQDSGTKATPTEQPIQDDDESSDVIVVDSDDECTKTSVNESVSSVPTGLKCKSLDDVFSVGSDSLAEDDLLDKEPIHKIQQKVSTQLTKPFSSYTGVSLQTVMKTTGIAHYNLFRCGNATCTYSALNSNDFRDHLIICEHAKEFDMLSCYHCSKEFRTAVRLLEHIRSHGIHRYQCSVCHYCSYGNAAVMQHMRKAHKSTSIITIPLKPLKNDFDKDFFICKGNSSKKKPGPKSRVSIDYSSATTPPPQANSPSKKNTFGPDEISLLPVNPILTEDIHCKVCNFATKVRSNLLRHLQMHANEIAVPSVAPINPVPHLQSNEMHFDKMTNLALSSNINKPKGKNVSKMVDKGNHPKYVPEKERFVCGSVGCEYISVDELMLRLHWETLHNGERIFHCVHCNQDVKLGNQYLSTGAIASHLRLHEDTLYGCEQCSFIHPLRRQVETHSIEVHGKVYSMCIREAMKSLPSESHDKGWQCSLCPAKCQTKDAIAAHCKQSHQVTHQYKCSMCDFGCSKNSLFKPHLKKHPNAAPKMLTMFNKAEEANESVVDNFPIWWKERKRRSTFSEDNNSASSQITNTNTPADQPSPSKLFKRNSEDSESNKVDPSSGVLPTYTCVQPDGENYKCPFCFKFTSPSYATMHSHLCEELNYRNWMCVTCGYKSFSSQNILAHSKLNHGMAQTKLLKGNSGLEFWIDGLFRVQDQMIEKFKQKQNLNATSEPVEESPLIIDEPPKIAEKDPGKKLNQCPHCDYQSVHPIHQHIKRHWKVKPLGCGYCSKSFVKLIEVKSHSKQAHAGLEFLCVQNVLPDTPEIIPLVRPNVRRTFSGHSAPTSLDESSKSSKPQILTKTHMCLKCEVHLNESDVEDHTKICKHDDKYPILPKKTIAFKCSICMQLTVNSVTLHQHFEEEHPGMEINYVMHAVGKPKTKRILPKSVLPDLPAAINDKTHFMCAYCYNKFASYTLYLQHHKSSHYDHLIRFQPLTLCDLSRSEEVKEHTRDKECCVVGCSYVAGNITELLSHIRSHYIVYKCHFCNTVFSLYKFYLNHSQMHLGMVCKSQDDFISNTVVQDRLKKIVGLYKTKALIATNSDERSYIFEDNIQFEPFVVSQIKLWNSKQTARKSTTTLGQLDWRSSPSSQVTVNHQSDYSFYGTKPKPIDLKKITINVEFFGSQKTLSVEQLKAIENLFPKLNVQDVMKQQTKMNFWRNK